MVACIATTELLNCLACTLLHEAAMLATGLEVEAATKSIQHLAGEQWPEYWGINDNTYTLIHSAVVPLKLVMWYGENVIVVCNKSEKCLQ